MPFTLKHNTRRIKHILADVFKGSTKMAIRDPKQHKIHKHHWFLGSLVILAGSWITHTTTATIYDNNYDNNASDKTLGFALLINDDAFTSAFAADSVDPQTLSVDLENLPSIEPLTIKPNLTETKHTIKKGESLGQIFKNRSLDLDLPYRISTHPEAKQLVSLSIGRELIFRSDEFDQLKEISYPVNALQELLVSFDHGEVTETSIVDIPFVTIQHNVSAEITSSLYDAAIDAGLSINLVMEMVRIFGWDVDFAQDIRSGDSFHVIYDEYQMNGDKLGDGDILAAEFVTQGNTYRAIRFEDEQGGVSYYTPEGQSMLGTFLRSPVEFSRISSRFGNRKHPILKTWRAHNGVDYAAPTGTPIRATANGKVISAGTEGGYGRTAILRHAGRFTTLYAHMNGFAKGIRSGVSVKQGDIIGYVGSTGLATGPHLHYEFRVDGVHKNPLTYKTPKATSIGESALLAFKNTTESLLVELDTISKNYQLAKSVSTSNQL